jgi:hypothetical protein
MASASQEPLRSERRLPSARDRLFLVVPLLAFVAATTHWMSWREPIRLHFAADVAGYEAIARAAPHFTWPQVEGHIGMWPVHYLVGLLSKGTHIPLHVTYYLLAFLVLGAIVFLLDRILCLIGVDAGVYALAMSAALMNPYVFRYLALAPGMLNDAVFIASVGLAVWAMLARRLAWVYVALVIGVLARDLSAPPVIVGVAGWLFFDLRNRNVALRRRIAPVTAVVFVPTAAAAVAYWAGTRAPGHAAVVKSCCSVWNLSILGDLRRLPGSAGSLALHVGRVGTGIALALALLLVALLLAHQSRLWRRAPDDVWGLLGLAAVMVAEPLLVSSVWNQGDEPRLSAFAIVPMVAAAALLLTRLQTADARESPARFTTRQVRAGIAVAAVASLSHRFALFGARSPAQFAALEFVSAAAFVWILTGRVLRRTHEAVPRSRHSTDAGTPS